MGVVHKLKIEIVDFIQQQKKDNPALSCRQLKYMINEKFQMQISKSSVNTVIKSAQLSSCVGRRPRAPSLDYTPSKKFKIPPYKKKQLFDGLTQFQTKQEMKPLSADQTFEPKPLFHQPHKEPLMDVDDAALPLIPDPLSQSRGEKPGKISHQAQPEQQTAGTKVSLTPQGPFLKGMGFIFLKAAEWEISKTPLLGGLLRSFAPVPDPLPAPSDRFDSVAESFVFLKILGQENFDEVSAYENHGLWVLNDLSCDPTDLKKFLDWTKTLSDQKSLAAKYLTEETQAFLEVNSFKLFLQDKSELKIDCRFSSLWADKVPAGLSLAVQKAMEVLSYFLISNNEPCLFKAMPLTKQPEAFYALLAAFENIK